MTSSKERVYPFNAKYFWFIMFVIRTITTNIRFTIVDSIAESNKVAIAWFVEATHEKDFRGIPATHKKFETVGMNVFHFEGNKIKEASPMGLLQH